MKGNNIIHYVADPQVMEMKATNSPVSTVVWQLTENKSFLKALWQFIVFSFVSAQWESRYIQ